MIVLRVCVCVCVSLMMHRGPRVCVCVIFEMKNRFSGHLNPAGFSLCPQPEKLSIKRPSITNRAHFFGLHPSSSSCRSVSELIWTQNGPPLAFGGGRRQRAALPLNDGHPFGHPRAGP